MIVNRRIVGTVAENVVAPIAIYLALKALGCPPVWALVGGAGASMLLLAVRFVRTHQLTTLGVVVLLRFVLDIAVAVITGDPRLQLAKDFAITGVFGLIAASSLLWRRPLIAYIRRDLTGRADAFDHSWAYDEDFRALHRRMTAVWAVGLGAEAGTGVVLVYSLPLTAAVLATSILAPATLLALIAWTQRCAASTGFKTTAGG